MFPDPGSDRAWEVLCRLLVLVLVTVALLAVPAAHASAVCDVECEECVGASVPAPPPLPVEAASEPAPLDGARPTGRIVAPPPVHAPARPRPPPTPSLSFAP